VKIMMVSSLYAPYQMGGAEISLQLLSEELVRRGHQVRVITLCDKPLRSFSIINGVEVVYIPLRNIYWPFSGRRRNVLLRFLWHIIDNYNLLMKTPFRKEVVEFQPDIVNTNNLSGFSVAVWSVVNALGITLVHTSRDYYLMHPNTTMYCKGKNIEPHTLSVFFWSSLKRIYSKKVNYYIGISFFIMDFHIKNKFFKNALKDYTYNPVSVYSGCSPSADVIRIGFIGRLTKEKGFDVYCRLIVKLRNAGYNIKAFAAGDCFDDNDEFRVMLHSADIIQMGRVNIEHFLNNVDIVIFPFQWREPFGRVVVESALAKKRVLINPVGGAGELLELIPSVKEITENNLEWALNSTTEVIVEPDVIKLFDIYNITDEYISTYDRARETTNYH